MFLACFLFDTALALFEAVDQHSMASSKRESDIDIQVSSDEEDDHPVGASTPNVDMIPVHGTVGVCWLEMQQNPHTDHECGLCIAVEVELHPQSVAEHDAVKKRVIDVLRDKATFVNGMRCSSEHRVVSDSHITCAQARLSFATTSP